MTNSSPIVLSDAFGQYQRKQIAELRSWRDGDDITGISISAEDAKAGSPKDGDMIARNPKNHADQWLVAAAYFADNFEPLRASSSPAEGEVEPVAWPKQGWALVPQGIFDRWVDGSAFNADSEEDCALLDEYRASTRYAASTHPLSPAPGVKTLTVDDLAQEIRRVDGNNSLGAGALAEALIAFLTTPADSGPVEVTEDMVERMAMFIARLFNSAWEGIGNNGRVTERGFQPIIFSMNAGMRLQGTQNDVRDIARAALTAALNLGRS